MMMDIKNTFGLGLIDFGIMLFTRLNIISTRDESKVSAPFSINCLLNSLKKRQ